MPHNHFAIALSLLFFTPTLSALKAQASLPQRINANDTVVTKIDSLVSTICRRTQKVISFNNIPALDGIPDYYTIDSVSLQITSATIFTCHGKIKTLTNYYFFENRLIEVDDDNFPLKDQLSSKYKKYDRTAYYWNDVLISPNPPGKSKFDPDKDLLNAKDILNRIKKNRLGN